MAPAGRVYTIMPIDRNSLKGVSVARTIDIVVGYLQDIDGLPRDAGRLALQERIAFVLPQRPNSVDCEPDPTAYLDLLRSIEEVLAPATIRCRTDERDVFSEYSPQSFLAYVTGMAPPLYEPLDRVQFLGDGRVLGLLVSEPWGRVGGPAPYHDSYVAALFTARDTSVLLQHIENILTRTGETGFGVIHRGAPRKHWSWKAYLKLFL